MTSSSGAFTINPLLKHKHKITSSMQHSPSPECHCFSSWITFTQRAECKNVTDVKVMNLKAISALAWHLILLCLVKLTVRRDAITLAEHCAKRTAAWSVMALLKRAMRWAHRAFIPTPTRVFIIFSCLCAWKPPQTSRHWISDAPVWTKCFHYLWFHSNGSIFTLVYSWCYRCAIDTGSLNVSFLAIAAW